MGARSRARIKQAAIYFFSSFLIEGECVLLCTFKSIYFRKFAQDSMALIADAGQFSFLLLCSVCTISTLSAFL